MIFSLEVGRARKGDSLLLHYGPEDDPGLAVIDGGPAGVYGPHLRPRLLEIKRARGLGERAPLPVDLLMVSHVDDDHVQGILDLTKELIEAGNARQPPLLRVLELWHNSFDAVVEDEDGDLAKAFGGHSAAASTAKKAPDEALLDDFDWPDEEKHEVAVSSFKVLAGLAQGFRLRKDAEKLGIEINPEFDGELILADEDAAPLEFDRGLAFTVAGPMKPELDALRKKHIAWLKELKAKGKSPSAALAAYVDRSVANLSSLVLIAELGGKRMLLTGDARGDKIIQGLQMVGALSAGDASEMHVDVLKVPHHGSARNLETDFFERITADHYVFSGDGEHGNPEREALEMLFDARGDAPFTVHLTYPVREIDAERKKDWEKEQGREKGRREKAKTAAAKKRAKVRPDWSPEEHGLEAFFRRRKLAPSQEIKVVDEDQPHLIDLLAPVTSGV